MDGPIGIYTELCFFSLKGVPSSKHTWKLTLNPKLIVVSILLSILPILPKYKLQPSLDGNLWPSS